MVEYRLIKVKTALSKSNLPDLDYALNPYIGCQHSCIYCYSPDFTRYSDVAENWGSKVLIKENIVEVLKREVRSLSKGIVGVSTITDPYQPIEAKMKLTRECIKVLSNSGFKVSIQTKSTLILRDSDIINPKNFDVGVTITTMRSEVAREIEPNAPPPRERLKILEYFSRRGVETWLFLGPIIPKINDDEEQLREVVEDASKIKTEIVYDRLNVKPLMLRNMRRKWSFQIDIREVVRLSYNDNYYIKISNTIERLCRRYGVKCSPAFTYKHTRKLTDFI